MHILHMDILTLDRLYYVVQYVYDIVIAEIANYAEHIYYIVGLYTILVRFANLLIFIVSGV